MRVLLSTTSGAGHFLPLLPVARVLAEAGHELACAAPVEARAMVEKAGLAHLPFDGVPPDNEERGAVFARVPELSHTDAEFLIGSEIFGRLNTSYALPGAQAAVAGFAPDLVVHESGELAVALAAELAGVRAVAVNPCLSLPTYLSSIAAGVADLRGDLGLTPDKEGAWLRRTETITWFPAAFDLPDLPGSRMHRYRAEAATPTPLKDRELVYVTLGSEASQLPFFSPIMRACVSGALEAGLPVLVATGRPVDAALFEGLEGDLTVEAWVDQDEVLARAKVVVCHAGAGTTIGCLRAAIPVVAVPIFADQPHNAARLEATGAGMQVAPGPDLQAEVAAAVRQLAGSEPTASLDLAAQIAALPAITEAVGWLEGR
jgi:UDP:flavonoid glycosyltransferase YjiC (YdhE family)